MRRLLACARRAQARARAACNTCMSRRRPTTRESAFLRLGRPFLWFTSETRLSQVRALPMVHERDEVVVEDTPVKDVTVQYSLP